MSRLFVTICLLLVFDAMAQNTNKSSNDFERIALATYVPNQIAGLPEEARSLLANKISQITSNNGMGGSSKNERFFMTCNVAVLTKEITSTSPSMTALNLEVTFYIGDALDGKKFASASVQVTGVAASETKAYIDAFKRIKIQDASIVTFADQGKNKIIEFYNSQCSFILSEAQAMVDQNKYDAALYKLSSIPMVSKTCFDKAYSMIAATYQRQIDYECQQLLIKANSVWNVKQNFDAAQEASSYLVKIVPGSKCYGEAESLNQKMGQRITEIDQREWNFRLKQQQDDIDIQKATIQAARDIGVAYGENQPNVQYQYETVFLGWR